METLSAALFEMVPWRTRQQEQQQKVEAND